MITYEEACVQQRKAQKKSLWVFFGSLTFLSAVCIGLSFAGKQELCIGFYLSLFVLIYIAYKVKITEFFRIKEYEGEVTYFNVREERIKKIHTHQVGSKYDTYGILFADIAIKDKNGKIKHKTFRYTKEYDNVKAGDHAVVLRFIDKPIIVFQK